MLYLCNAGDNMYASQVKTQLEQLKKKMNVYEFYLLNKNQDPKKLGIINYQKIDKAYQLKIILNINPIHTPYELGGFDFIYSRSSLAGHSAILLKKKHQLKAKIITDFRGLVSDEVILEKKITSKLKSKFYEHIERNAAKKSDLILVVSENFKEILIKKIPGLKKDSIFALRPFIDTKKFFYSEEKRKNTRKSLGIKNNETLLVYCGGISKWQCIDETLLMFKKLNKFNSSIKLLMLVSNTQHITEKSKELHINKESIITMTVKNDEVNNYYNAADFGLLLREKSLTNEVAYPTKFSEYLLSGLPVIMTKHIGCIKDANKQNAIIIENTKPKQDILLKKITKKFNRQKISSTYRKLLIKNNTSQIIEANIK